MTVLVTLVGLDKLLQVMRIQAEAFDCGRLSIEALDLLCDGHSGQHVRDTDADGQRVVAPRLRGVHARPQAWVVDRNDGRHRQCARRGQSLCRLVQPPLASQSQQS